MADEKLSELSDAGTLAAADLKYVVKSDGASPPTYTSYQTTVQNEMNAVSVMTEDTAPDGSADFLLSYDASASAAKKVKPNTVLGLVNGLTEDASPSYLNDFVLTYDASASAAKKVKLSTAVPINIGFTALGAVLTSSEVFGKWVATEAFTLPASLTGSQAHAQAASTGTAVIDLAKNGVNFGTVTFTASATGVVAAASSTSFSAGDRLTATGPASADATLAGIAISLKGTRD